MPTFSRSFGPVTARKVAAFERRVGLKLPDDYKRFLIETNGGTPSPDGFMVPGCGVVMLGCLYGIRGKAEPLDLAQEQINAQESDPLPSGFLAIGEDPGGNLLLMNTTKGGAVDFWDRVGFYARTTPGRNTYRVADSFTAFLESLHDPQE